MFIVQNDHSINAVFPMFAWATREQEFIVIDTNGFKQSEVSSKYYCESSKGLSLIFYFLQFHVKCIKDSITHDWYLINHHNSYILSFIPIINAELFVSLVKKRSFGNISTGY